MNLKFRNLKSTRYPSRKHRTVKYLLKIYHFILYCMIALLLFLSAVSLLPRFAGIKPYIVLSGSMEPEIHTGSMAFINSNIDPYEIHTGDIITYKRSDQAITHRVVDETVTSVITKGDANEEADFSPVTRDMILGKFLFSIPSLGYLYDSLSTPYLFSVLVALFTVELIISFINQFISKKEEQT